MAAENDDWSKPSLKRNNQTGEFGYWTGSDMIVLPKSMSSDHAGAQALIDNLKQTPQPPKFENFSPEETQAVQKLYKAVRSPQPGTQPAPSATQPGIMDKFLESARQVRQSFDPKELLTGTKMFEDERTRQQGMSKGAVAKDMALEVLGGIPAMIGGGAAAAILPKAVSKIGSLLRAGGVGSGAAGGEYLSQQAGLSPDSLTGLVAAGAGGALAGALGGKITKGAKTTPERKAVSIAKAAPVREQEIASKAQFKEKLNESLSRPDVDSQRIIQPIEDIVMKERGRRPGPTYPGRMTPETYQRDQIVNELSDIASNLGNVVNVKVGMQPGVPLPQTPTPKPVPGAASLQTPPRTAIPGPGSLASEAEMPSMTRTKAGIATKQPQAASAYGTPATQANQPQSPAPGRLVVTGVSQKDSAQTVVEEVQRLAKLKERARQMGANDLSHDIDRAMQQVRKTVGYDQAAPFWERGKTFEESKINIRGASKTAREMNKFEGRRINSSLTEQQRQGLIKMAASSEQIDGLLSWMMRNPAGQSLLKHGIMPDGTIKPATLHIAAQLAARFIANGEE